MNESHAGATTHADTRDGARIIVPEVVLILLSDVTAAPVTWLWPGRIARGKVTLLVGDPGLGKTFVALDVMARLSRGLPWPAGEGSAPKGTSVLLTVEDDLRDTIRPRLDALGADASAVFALQAVRPGGIQAHERLFSLDADIPQLEEVIRTTGAIFVMIDPLSAYLGHGTDSFREADVRRVLSPLAALAAKTRVAVLGIMHLTKQTDRAALARVQGSTAFGALARVVIAVAVDPKDPSRRLLGRIKGNIGAPPPVLGFTIDDGRLVWRPAAIAGADMEAILRNTATGPSPSKVAEACAWLRGQLAEGAQPAEDVKAAAEREGISGMTLRRSRKELGIVIEWRGQHESTWALPDRECSTVGAPSPSAKIAQPPSHHPRRRGRKSNATSGKTLGTVTPSRAGGLSQNVEHSPGKAPLSEKNAQVINHEVPGTGSQNTSHTDVQNAVVKVATDGEPREDG